MTLEKEDGKIINVNREYGDLVFDFVNKNENMPVPRQIINIYKELSQ